MFSKYGISNYERTSLCYAIAEGIAEEEGEPLSRKQKYTVKTKKRKRPENVKERIIKERGFIKVLKQDPTLMQLRALFGLCCETVVQIYGEP